MVEGKLPTPATMEKLEETGTMLEGKSHTPATGEKLEETGTVLEGTLPSYREKTRGDRHCVGR